MTTICVSAKPTGDDEFASILERLLTSISHSDIAYAASIVARGMWVLWHQGALTPYCGRWPPITLDGGVRAEAWSREPADLIEPGER